MATDTPETVTEIPSMESAGFVVPNVGPDGAPLSRQQQFSELLKNPTFVEQALVPHTPAAAWVEQMNRQLAGLAEPGAPLAPPPATRPEQYTIPYAHGMDASAWTPERQAADLAMRNWLSAGGLGPTVGSNLAALADERARDWARKSDAEWGEAAAKADATLRDLYGDRYEARMAVAKDWVNAIEAKHPGLKAFLDATGLGNDEQFINTIVCLAEAQQASV